MRRHTLIALFERGERPEIRLFYGHTPKRRSVADASCFSQWFPAAFTVDGDRYATAEHFMMAGKARLFRDEEILEEILASDDPGEAKALGRRVRGFDGELWDAHKFDIVVRGNVAKFGQRAGLGDYLLSTAEAVLVEAAPRDRVWGIGLGRNNPAALDPRTWRGQNLLGFALMEARDRLR